MRYPRRFGLPALFKLGLLCGFLLLIGKWFATISNPESASIFVVLSLFLWVPTCFGR